MNQTSYGSHVRKPSENFVTAGCDAHVRETGTKQWEVRWDGVGEGQDTYKHEQNIKEAIGRPLGRAFKKILGAFPAAARPS
jgi:hypothetical protein